MNYAAPLPSKPPTVPIRYADAFELVARGLAPPERLSVAEAAEKYMMLDNPGGGYRGPFRFDAVPYLKKPMDCLSPDSPVKTVAIQGPAQCAKSTVGNGWLVHSVKCD